MRNSIIKEWYKTIYNAYNQESRFLSFLAALVLLYETILSPFTGRSLESLAPIPPVATACISLLFIFLYRLITYATQLRKQIRSGRLQLAKLRAEGVEIRNEGKHLSLEKLQPWKENASTWNENVIAAIKQVSEADAEWFKILDIVPECRVQFYPDISSYTVGGEEDLLFREHERELRFHDFRVWRLGEIVHSLWREYDK